MNNIFAIKEEFKSTIVGFNGSGLPLGERTDLDKLAEMARFNPSLANFFVKCPTPEEITAFKENRLLAVTEAPAPEVEAEPETNSENQPSRRQRNKQN